LCCPVSVEAFVPKELLCRENNNSRYELEYMAAIRMLCTSDGIKGLKGMQKSKHTRTHTRTHARTHTDTAINSLRVAENSQDLILAHPENKTSMKNLFM
jgi:hypothetical protein